MKEPLPKKVHAALRARMFEGSLPPGTRLDYKQLAQELGVSTAPVREAVAQLASEGIVDLVPRLGAVVRSLNQISAHEFYEVREAVETFAALKAAERHTPRHLELLNKHLDIMKSLAFQGIVRGGDGVDLTEVFLATIPPDSADRRRHRTGRVSNKTLSRRSAAPLFSDLFAGRPFHRMQPPAAASGWREFPANCCSRCSLI